MADPSGGPRAVVGPQHGRVLPSERLLATIWERQWLDGRPLIDSHGRELRVVYPGRRWGGPGPDFRGAVLALRDGTLLRGDVEIHRTDAGWRAHGHDRDAAYNRTVLHVVLRIAAGARDARLDGAALPVLELAGRLAAPLPELAERLVAEPEPPLQTCLESAAALRAVVDRAALARFLAKAAVFEADLAVVEPTELLYRGLLIALGYSANKEAAARLAELVPWSLARWVARELGGELALRALLLGAAGLLPSQRGLPIEPGEPQALEDQWRIVQPELGRRPLPPSAWRWTSVRPENWPTRRLVGAAAILAAWTVGDPLEALATLLLSQRTSPARLVERWKARSSAAYWAWHYDFRQLTAGPRPWQIGRGRAMEILVNAVLPLVYALGRSTDRPELAAAALLAYRRLPAAPWNRRARVMAGQLFGPDGVRLCASAARQQGLLHLFNGWCWERRCERCPAGGRANPVVATALV